MSDTSSQGKGFFVGHGWMKGDTAPPPVLDPPTLTSILPASAYAYEQEEVHFYGTGFTAESKLRIDDVPMGPLYALTLISDTELMLPAHTWAPGDNVVLVDNSGVYSNTVVFTAMGIRPDVTAVIPDTGTVGVLTTHTIQGAGGRYEADAVVEFDGVAAATTFIDAFQLTADFTPSAAGSVAVTVSDADGTSPTSVTITVT